ncbi:unnamed protein product, partial [Heterotrigona itama]
YKKEGKTKNRAFKNFPISLKNYANLQFNWLEIVK